MRLAVGRRHLSEAMAVRPGQKPVEDFLLDQWQQRRDIVRPLEQTQQAKCGIFEFDSDLANAHAAHGGGGCRQLRQGRKQRLDLTRIEREGHAEIGLVCRGLADLGQNRQVDRRQQIIRGAVDQRLFAENHALCSLHDDRQTRPVGGAVNRGIAAVAVQAQAGNLRHVNTVGFGKPGNDVDHLGTGSLSRGCHNLRSFQRLSVV